MYKQANISMLHYKVTLWRYNLSKIIIHEAIVDKTKKISPNSGKEHKSPTGLRPVRLNEINQVHIWLMQAIDESPFYNEEFKQFEKSRLTKSYLLQLFNHDPAHIMLMLDNEQPCGFMISGPEFGTIWLYWSYLLPAHRKGLLAMSAMRAFIKYWDNGGFHKIATYTKDGNRPAEMIMKRVRFKHICTLEKHIFGEDYHLYELPLNKVSKGYDKGVSSSRLSRLKIKIRHVLGLS